MTLKEQIEKVAAEQGWTATKITDGVSFARIASDRKHHTVEVRFRDSAGTRIAEVHCTRGHGRFTLHGGGPAIRRHLRLNGANSR